MEEKTTYLVMETHPAYVILLDSEGRFLKAANYGYERGERIHTAVLFQDPKEALRRRRRRALRAVAALAACICLAAAGGWQYREHFVPYGTLRVEINPEVELEISHSGKVLRAEGLDADGDILLDGYDIEGKDLYEAARELAVRAIRMNYLQEGGAIRLTAASGHSAWEKETQEAVTEDLEAYLADYNIHILSAYEPVPAPVPESEDPEMPAQEAPQQNATAQEDLPQNAPADADDDDDGSDNDGGDDDSDDDGNDDDSDDDSDDDDDDD